MTVPEREGTEEQDRLVAELLRQYPPIRRLEELMGPPPTADEAGEVDRFLQARAQWQQRVSPAEDGRVRDQLETLRAGLS